MDDEDELRRDRRYWRRAATEAIRLAAYLRDQAEGDRKRLVRAETIVALKERTILDLTARAEKAEAERDRVSQQSATILGQRDSEAHARLRTHADLCEEQRKRRELDEMLKGLRKAAWAFCDALRRDLQAGYTGHAVFEQALGARREGE